MPRTSPNATSTEPGRQPRMRLTKTRVAANSSRDTAMTAHAKARTTKPIVVAPNPSEWSELEGPARATTWLCARHPTIAATSDTAVPIHAILRNPVTMAIAPTTSVPMNAA
jgi:hypothetical protein